jgi:hypothetical protein
MAKTTNAALEAMYARVRKMDETELLAFQTQTKKLLWDGRAHAGLNSDQMLQLLAFIKNGLTLLRDDPPVKKPVAGRAEKVAKVLGISIDAAEKLLQRYPHNEELVDKLEMDE